MTDIPASEARLARARRALAAPTRIAVLTGAGMSTEAGVPDFRSPDGLYAHDFHGLHPETVLSIDFLEAEPERFFEYLRTRLAFRAEPDESYRMLADLEAQGRVVAVVTQNIDGLHLAAGSRRVIEAHGTLARFSCAQCGRPFDAAAQMRPETPIRCACGGIVRPEVVLYGEGLAELDAAFAVVDEADALLVLGTSLLVYPVAAIPQLFVQAGKPVVIVNREATPVNGDAGVIEINAGIGATLRQLFAG